MVAAHYKTILTRSEEALDALAADEGNLSSFTTAHNFAEDLDALEALVQGRPEEKMFKLARVEYQHALYSAAVAQYRQAHVSLRLFFELSLCSVLFSAHEIDTKLWLKGQKDSNWSAISCKEKGVFSKHFVGAFFEEMKEYSPQYNALATQLYRECSEFVHGNRQSYDGLDGQIAYNAEILERWSDRADTARLVVKFAFVCRYLMGATTETKNDLESLALENFGELPPVQAIYSGVAE